MTLSELPVCPKCGSPMALRTAKKGRNAGGQFWGCTTVPRCRGIRDFGDKREPVQLLSQGRCAAIRLGASRMDRRRTPRRFHPRVRVCGSNARNPSGSTRQNRAPGHRGGRRRMGMALLDGRQVFQAGKFTGKLDQRSLILPCRVIYTGACRSTSDSPDCLISQ